MDYGVIVENSLTGLYILQDGAYAFVNTAFAEMHGYTRDELIGEDYMQLIHPDEREAVKERVSQILRGQNERRIVKNRTLKKDGTTFWCQILENIITYQGKPAIIGSAIDITEHKNKEDILIDEANRRRILVEQSRDGIVVLNTDGKVQEANQQFANMLGYSLKEMANLHVWDWEFQYTQEQVVEMIRSVNEAGDHFETKHRRKDGTTYNVEISTNGSMFGGQKLIFCVCRDITERKKSEEEMSRLYKKLEQRQQQNNVLSEMRNMLELCTSIEEIPAIIKGAINKLFPETDGALFLLSNSRTDLGLNASWGDFSETTDETAFAPDECWGLRRGQIHVVENTKTGTVCSHLKNIPPTAYVCLPLIAKSDVQGLLHFRINRSISEQEAPKTIVDFKDIMVILGEYVSLSIANLKLRDSLKNLSIRDHLTGLFNRRYMEEMVQREILRAKRNQTKLGIMMADIDHFKQFNDRYGHEAGDQLLVQLANYFKAKIRGSDIVSRYGGEEFVFCLSESSVENTYKRANMIIDDIRKMNFDYRGHSLPSVTISIGISSYPDHGKTMDDLLRVADSALYAAKQEGRDRVVVGNS